MNSSYQVCLSSRPFHVIGPSGNSFYVHGSSISKHSPVLAKDVNGTMLESTTKEIRIVDIEGDIDDDTVARFIEYVYSSEYTEADPEVVISSTKIDYGKGDQKNENSFSSIWSEPTAEPSTAAHVMIPSHEVVSAVWPWSWPLEVAAPPKAAHPLKPKKIKVKPSLSKQSKAKMWSRFQSSTTVTPETAWKPRRNDDPCEDFTPIFLCHARLCVFANRYQCEDLMLLAIEKLHRTLSQFTLWEKRRQDIAQLAWYVYTHAIEFSGTYARLRNVLIRYLACHVEDLMQNDDFKALLQEPGPFARDLMLKVMQRLN